MRTSNCDHVRRTQPFTVADRRDGQIRAPQATKPRTDGDRERSGVLGFGRGKLDGPIEPGEPLHVCVHEGTVHVH